MNAPVKPSPSRRSFLVGATLAGGTLLVGCSPAELLSAGSKVAEPGAFGPFIRIAADGAVTVVCKHIEFGQGTHAGLAAIVAEELDADWSKVKVDFAPANAKLYGGAMGVQGTGGSSAINGSWDQLRQAGASARAMFVAAAAKRWNVPASEIAVRDGIVSHAGARKAASLGELVNDAAAVEPPQDAKPKDPATFTLIGSDRVRRKDAQAKSDGTARYTQDVRLPDMLVAMVVHAPKFGAKLSSFDDTEARKVAGVVDVFKIPTGVAVVANDTWSARQGRDAVVAKWDESKAETRSSDALAAEFRALAGGKAPPEKTEWKSFMSKGAALAGGGQVVEATFDFPYLAHAAMEPMNCVAQIGGGKAKLTFGSQIPTIDQLNAAKIVGTLPGMVEIETLLAGGSFGRRANFQSDYVSECVHIAKHVGKGRPVKLVWTREDDMQAGYFRPLTHHRVRVTLDKDGYPASWIHKVVSQSIMKGSPMGAGDGVEETAVEGVKGSPYFKAIPHVDAQAILPDVGVPVLWWRSVGSTHTAMAMEHTIDLLARKAGKDPVEYRRALLQKADAKRHLAALDLAVAKAGAATPGWSRGVAVHESFGTVVAQVAEVKLENGEPRVGRVVTAIDCGTAVSPNQVAAQMEGGTCFGLSAALYGAVTLKDGAVEQTNFDSYRVLRMNEAPNVETYIVPQPAGAAPTGVGEPGTPVIAPAVANALLALTGQPVSSLPLVKA